MSRKKSTAAESAECRVYQLKVTLSDVRPAVWRRLLVLGDTRLDGLHWILQVAMPWTNSHLHEFILKTKSKRPTKEDWEAAAALGPKLNVNAVYGERHFSLPAFELEEAADETRGRLDEVAPPAT